MAMNMVRGGGLPFVEGVERYNEQNLKNQTRENALVGRSRYIFDMQVCIYWVKGEKTQNQETENESRGQIKADYVSDADSGCQSSSKDPHTIHHPHNSLLALRCPVRFELWRLVAERVPVANK